ncbi:regulator of chromosome condensation [Anaeramoeba ignava]|uniref:Regulator of chromosome condensation n=1 Tax=Anaeramoeba ignava TaxID=1746090 RepID=A0A9Q0RBH7_ANAIG|nr:regulator of chromosome condensation [Anaeramoeba ignava]
MQKKTKNEVWFFGENHDFILFPNEPELITKSIEFEIENEFKNEFKNEKQIKQIVSNVSIGSQNEAILTFEGNVFAKGYDINPNYPNEFINISSLIKDPNDRIIEDIICGENSIYLLTSNQNAYGIGSNESGQLGVDLPTESQRPILMMKNVSKIFSGNSSSSVFILNSNHELFGCGFNRSNKIGFPSERREIKELIKIQNIPKGEIIDIQTGNFHSIMLIEDEDENENENQNQNQKRKTKRKRKLYSCGYYQYNGLNRKDDIINQFTEIKSYLFENDNILQFSVGYDHTLILTSKQKFIGFGNNEFYQLGTRNNISNYLIPIQIELPKLRFNEDISNYHLICGYHNSFLYYSPPLFTNLEKDLIKLFRRKEFYEIENQIEKLKEIISKKSIKESNQIFEMIYSNNSKINPKSYSEIKEIINSNEKIEETMKRIYLNENEKDFIIERKSKHIKFPKLILIMRSELYRGMFLSVKNDKSNQIKDESGLSDEAFEILEYWIYSNQIKKGIQITQEIIKEIKTGIDYFQLNHFKKENLIK